MDSIAFNQPAIRQQIQRAGVSVNQTANIILDSADNKPDYELAAQPMTFNDQGVCTNPKTELMIEKALMSATCPVWIKNAVLKNAESYPEQFRALLQGMLSKGLPVDLTDTSSANLDLHDLDFSGGKLLADGARFDNLYAAGTNFSGGSFNDMMIYSGDLSNAIFKEIHCDAGFAVWENRVITDGMKLGMTAKQQILYT